MVATFDQTERRLQVDFEMVPQVGAIPSQSLWVGVERPGQDDKVLIGQNLGNSPDTANQNATVPFGMTQIVFERFPHDVPMSEPVS